MTIAAAARQAARSSSSARSRWRPRLGAGGRDDHRGARNKVKLAIGHMPPVRHGLGAGARPWSPRGRSARRKPLWSLDPRWTAQLGHPHHRRHALVGDPATDWVLGAVERNSDRYERGLRIEDAATG